MSEPIDVKIESNATIAQAESFSSQLEDAFRKSHSVRFDGSAVDRIDTSTLQLLVAFFRDMEHAGIQVAWVSVSDALVTSAKLLGVDKAICLTR